MFVGKESHLEEGFRRAPDGLLERQVMLNPPANTQWVPIVPDGLAVATLTWKRWVFLQCHIGILGAHRSDTKTTMIMNRLVWWNTMKTDVAGWVDKCMTCLRFRRMTQKQEMVAVIPVDAECWEEVMIDLEGPCNPVDNDGCRKLVLNFDKVEYLSSAALGKLITLDKKVKAQAGRMKLCHIKEGIYEVFKITRLNKVFDIQDDEQSSVDGF